MESNPVHPPLTLEHTFLASAPTLFDAWLTPPVTERWLFQFEENPVRFFAEPKEGGAFHTEAEKDGQVSHFGQYISIERPHKLAFTLQVPDHFEGESEVTILIQEMPQGTRLSFIQKNVDTSGNVRPWQNMFADLEKLLVQPYLVTNESGVPQLVEAINITVMQFAGFFLPLNDELINTIPFKNAWTPAQLIRHITRSMSGIGALLTKEVKTAERDPHEKILLLKQTFLDLTHTMQSPDFIVPEEKLYQKDTVLAELYNCLADLNHAQDKIEGTGIITGLPLGEVTQIELLHFVFYHTQRHLVQMKRITDALTAAS